MLVICNKREMDSGVSECLADMFSSAKIRPKLVRRFTQELYCLGLHRAGLATSLLSVR